MQIIKGKQLGKPFRGIIYGLSGAGKSTLANTAPKAIFLNCEDGLNQIDCHKTPLIKSIDDLKNYLAWLLKEKHGYETVVLDTADAMDLVISEEICRTANKKSLGDFGYGAGYDLLVRTWNSLLTSFDSLHAKGINTIVTAHPVIMSFQDPTGESYDKFTLKVNKKVAGTLIARSDFCYFLDYEKVIKKNAQDKGKAVATGDRILHTKCKLSFDAKDRYSMPEKIIVNDKFNLSIFSELIKQERK
jgi:hypothetical protein